MKIAGWMALLIAALLLGTALTDWNAKVNATADNIQRGYADMGDTVAFNQDMTEWDAEQAAIDHEAVGGAVFLVGGVALIGAARKRRRTEIGAASSSATVR